MPDLLKEITQISIYIKEAAERVNEVALTRPLARSSQFDEESRAISARKWRYTNNLPLFRLFAIKLRSFLFKRLPTLIPSERLTPEAKFKTVLAMLLAQEEVRHFFLGNLHRRQNFFLALKEAATLSGYGAFSHPNPILSDDALMISRKLTTLEGKHSSLIDDLSELNLQIAALRYHERNEILYRILNRVERPPIHSVMEITGHTSTHAIPLTTQYFKYRITQHDTSSGNIIYSLEQNHATSSIRTMKNTLPNAKGAMNQRCVSDSETNTWIGSYCGELSTSFNVLEQILLILGQRATTASVVGKTSQSQVKNILFTSLYSWDEMGLITDQLAAIRQWDQKFLKCGEEDFKLNLLYFNIPFNALNKYPAPAEIKARMQDLNDASLLPLIAAAWQKLGLHLEEFTALAHRSLMCREQQTLSFLEKERLLLEKTDHFRKLKARCIEQLDSLNSTPFIRAIKALISDKKPDGKALKGIDKLLYLDYVSQELGYIHNKNCQNSTDRSAGADAADKAQYAFQKIRRLPFLPGHEKENEKALFQVLYSMYLVWEEPEINTWLSTGLLGEKFYKNVFQKNPETTRYLVYWLKKHPEMYLGLSDYRT